MSMHGSIDFVNDFVYDSDKRTSKYGYYSEICCLVFISSVRPTKLSLHERWYTIFRK